MNDRNFRLLMYQSVSLILLMISKLYVNKVLHIVRTDKIINQVQTVMLRIQKEVDKL